VCRREGLNGPNGGDLGGKLTRELEILLFIYKMEAFFGGLWPMNFYWGWINGVYGVYFWLYIMAISWYLCVFGYRLCTYIF
jgi:hypothetical protein